MSKKKFCVFCGQKPEKKNKEHVLPRWLIQLTGKPNREINVGLNFSNLEKNTKVKNRKYSINSFTLPACEECNTEYAKLEAKTKPIMNKILSDSEINSIEMSLLLDWFDKVRVGLWLMYFTLDNNWTDISPKFHIARRIGQFDRFLHISKCNSTEKRLNFIGVQSFSFQTTPSVFGLVVNNFMFTNISYQGLISRRVGFPYIINEYLANTNELDKFEVEINEIGLKRIMKPIIRKQLSIKGNSFYQAIYNEELIVSDKSFMKIFQDNDYVKLNSLEDGKSKIIYNNSFINNIEEPISITSDFCYDDCSFLSIKLTFPTPNYKNKYFTKP